MKTVLLTGANGFVGRHCLPHLARRGYDIHALSRRTPPQSLAGERWHTLDLLHPADVSALVARLRPTHLCHLAWVTAPGEYPTSPANLLWVQGTLHLLQAFVGHGGRRIVVAGTCAEYDWRYGICREDLTPLVPTTPYGLCKHALRLLVESFGAVHGVSSAWARLFFLYGPHEHPGRLIPSLIRSLLRAEPAPPTHGGVIRDFLYIDDAADALISLLDSDFLGPMNIASGIPTQVREVTERISDSLAGRRLLAEDPLSLPEDTPPVLIADVTRMRHELSWSPNYTLGDGLQRAIQWWDGVMLQGEEST